MEIEGVELTKPEGWNEAEEESAFEAGFEGADIEEVPEPQEGDTTEQTESETPPPEQEPEPEAPKQLTYADLQEALAAQKAEMQKVQDRLFGKLGEFQQKIEAARSKATGLSPKARANLEENFPELAAALFDGAEEPAPQPAPQPQVVYQDTRRIDELRLEFEKKLLSKDHRDWAQVLASQEFADWKDSSLPAEEAAELLGSVDSDFVSAKISQYKEWKQQQTAKAQTAQKKQDRLEAAITPQGIPRTQAAGITDDDEEAALLASFRPWNKR